MSTKRRKPAAQPGNGRPQRRPAGSFFARFLLAASLLALVVLASASLTRLLAQPDLDALNGAAAEASRTPTPEPTPSPVPTLTPTPRANAPFGAQYGYGGEDLIPETPRPEETPVVFSPAPAETPEPAPTPEGYATLRRGANGEDVRRMQEALIALGYLSGEADGDFGAGTRAAVVQFQAVNSLTADGIAGQRTLSLLYGGGALPASAAPAMDFVMLVNRKHTVDSDYVPSGLVRIDSLLPSSLVKMKYKGTQANKTAVQALGRMLEAAAEEGIGNWQISSAYRTGRDQQKLVDNSVAAYLRNHADWSKKQALSATYNTVAPAGASEHQTGLAFDVTVPGESFTGTKQQIWMHTHCHEYGFVVRYTKDKQKITGFIAESWHIRYVGEEPAAIMAKNDWCLEEYLQHMGIVN